MDVLGLTHLAPAVEEDVGGLDISVNDLGGRVGEVVIKLILLLFSL